MGNQTFTKYQRNALFLLLIHPRERINHFRLFVKIHRLEDLTLPRTHWNIIEWCKISTIEPHHKISIIHKSILSATTPTIAQGLPAVMLAEETPIWVSTVIHLQLL